MKMKFAFCTCVQIGLSCMEAIYRAGGELDLIITLKDEKARKKSGRIYVDEFAAQHDIPVLKINHINDDEVVEALRENGIDWLFIIGWSQIAASAVLKAPRQGIIGAHPTLLPEGRGRAAIPWAIIKGLDRTGVSFFKMDEGVDTGPILGQYVIMLDASETASQLYEKVNKAHELLIEQIWNDLATGKILPVDQDESRATYWEGRNPEDGRLSLSMAVAEADRLVRATTRPYPGAFIDHPTKGLRTIWSGKIGFDPSALYTLDFHDGIYSVMDEEGRFSDF